MSRLNLSANACYDCLKLAHTITDLIGSQLAAHATKRLAGHLPFYGYNIPTQHAVSVAIYHGEDVDFVFFSANKRVLLVQFSLFYFRRHGRVRQFGSVLAGPVDHALRIELQDPCNRAVAVYGYEFRPTLNHI